MIALVFIALSAGVVAFFSMRALHNVVRQLHRIADTLEEHLLVVESKEEVRL